MEEVLKLDPINLDKMDEWVSHRLSHTRGKGSDPLIKFADFEVDLF